MAVTVCVPREQEFAATLRHDARGVLAMANSGPNTNGSQLLVSDCAGPDPCLLTCLFALDGLLLAATLRSSRPRISTTSTRCSAKSWAGEFPFQCSLQFFWTCACVSFRCLMACCFFHLRSMEILDLIENQPCGSESDAFVPCCTRSNQRVSRLLVQLAMRAACP